MKLDPGTEVSHYKILSEIGKGGMGTVYLARDTKLERKVAIKFLSKEWSGDKDKLQRFQQEAKAASALNHPNILTIYEIDQVEGVPYISAEFINGTDVSSYVSEGKISLIRVLDITMQIATALNTAHEAGIVHRDIKPDNVMIRDDGIVKILDFGLAKLTEKASTTKEKVKGKEGETLITGTAASPKTLPGIVMGTANYMSPEQARGKDVDQRSDIFSFGALIYEMLTRKRPFDGETTSDVIAAVLTKNPVPVRKLNKDIPKALSKIVERSLEKSREKRFQSIAELIGQLEALITNLQIDEIEKTILPENENRKTKILKVTTGENANQTTAAAENINDSILIKKSSFSTILIGGLAILLIASIGFGYWYLTSGNSGQIKSIAVMPFVNDSGDKDFEYLSDGMTETLIGRLSQIPELRVKARSSVFRYKGKDTDLQTIGRELNVQAILNGRVVQRDDQITLSLELVDVSTESVIWSQRYDRKQADLVTLQNEIARDVSSKLESKLSGAKQQQLEKTQTTNVEAYKLYLRGVFHLNKREISESEKALNYFQQAARKDPDYALAYVGIANAHWLMDDVNKTDSEVAAATNAALDKALRLDPDLGEPYATAALVKNYINWDYIGAEKDFKKAIELNPNYSTAHHWYAEALCFQGRFDECFAEYERALEIDPLSLAISTDLGLAYFNNRQYDRAIRQLEKSIELDPKFVRSYEYLAIIYEEKGMIKRAIELNTKADTLRDDSKAVKRDQQALLNAYETSGAKGYWNELLRQATEANQNGTIVSDFYLSNLYARLGDTDRAFEHLEAGLTGKRKSDSSRMLVNPALDPLRTDPRFSELLKKTGYSK